jgi:hypothetical protein
MPCESTGFTLKADNFFNGNPTIDLPPDTDTTSVNAPNNSTTTASTSTSTTCCGVKRKS